MLHFQRPRHFAWLATRGLQHEKGLDARAKAMELELATSLSTHLA